MWEKICQKKWLPLSNYKQSKKGAEDTNYLLPFLFNILSKMNNRISTLTRILLILSALSLVISIFVPLWQIQLDAPQYPEGLILKIFSDKLGGDVEIINGLNHYIGMKTLHAKDFIEFSILVYIISFFALFCVIAAIAGRKKVLYTLFAMFVLFGVVAMVDFWRWEYNYGHELNPNAAIIVPGMAYQPPLIGFKQLLNFGAYSIPDVGGWLFISSGLLMLIGVLEESGLIKKMRGKKKGGFVSIIIIVLSFSACGKKQIEPIALNKDHCDFCRMTISDLHFASEIITNKGRIYKFDDAGCMMNYKKENIVKLKNAQYYVCDFSVPHALMPVEKMTFVSSSELGSPMGGNLAAFSNEDSAKANKIRLGGDVFSWGKLINS